MQVYIDLLTLTRRVLRFLRLDIFQVIQEFKLLLTAASLFVRIVKF